MTTPWRETIFNIIILSHLFLLFRSRTHRRPVLTVRFVTAVGAVVLNKYAFLTHEITTLFIFLSHLSITLCVFGDALAILARHLTRFTRMQIRAMHFVLQARYRNSAINQNTVVTTVLTSPLEQSRL